MAGIDPRYADVEYWDVRYNDDRNTDGTYDWLTVWTNVADIVKALVPNTDTPCLHPGCGNATFSNDMYDAGYTDQTSIDISEVGCLAVRVSLLGIEQLFEWTLLTLTGCLSPAASLSHRLTLTGCLSGLTLTFKPQKDTKCT